MKKTSFELPVVISCFAILLWLAGSTLAHLRNGIELSLWLMSFAIMISFAATVFPWLGIRWLRLKKKGCLLGQHAAKAIQIATWGIFAWAMILRLNRSMSSFHILIAVVTLLWAAWGMIFTYSRYICKPKESNDKLHEDTQPNLSVNRNREDE